MPPWLPLRPLGLCLHGCPGAPSAHASTAAAPSGPCLSGPDSSGQLCFGETKATALPFMPPVTTCVPTKAKGKVPSWGSPKHLVLPLSSAPVLPGSMELWFRRQGRYAEPPCPRSWRSEGCHKVHSEGLCQRIPHSVCACTWAVPSYVAGFPSSAPEGFRWFRSSLVGLGLDSVTSSALC